MTQDHYKQQAAEQAAGMVEPGMVIGLGTGSTAAFFIDALIARRLDILCIPTSERSAAQAREGGLKLVGFDTHGRIDLCVDGADEIQPGSLDLVKGLGGALLREKIVASAAKRLVIIADESKLVERIGASSAIPVEVTAFGWELTRDRLAGLCGHAERRMGMHGAAYVTDGGNYIVDCRVTPVMRAGALNQAMRDIVGVVETGLFIGMAEAALVAGTSGVTSLTRR